MSCSPLGKDVMSVLLNSGNNEGNFLLVEEFQAPCLGRKLREVDDESKRDNRHDTSQNSLRFVSACYRARGANCIPGG